MARVEQIVEKDQLAAEFHPLYDRIAAARGRMAGPYSILLHSPAIADRVDHLSNALRNESVLSTQDLVLAALAVARARDCLFVWSVQAPAARRAGLSEEVIAAVRDRQTGSLSDDQLDLVRYAAQVATENRPEEDVFRRLEERHGVRWLVEITAVAGHFNLISGVNNAFEVPPAPDGDQLPV